MKYLALHYRQNKTQQRTDAYLIQKNINTIHSIKLIILCYLQEFLQLKQEKQSRTNRTA